MFQHKNPWRNGKKQQLRHNYTSGSMFTITANNSGTRLLFLPNHIYFLAIHDGHSEYTQFSNVHHLTLLTCTNSHVKNGFPFLFWWSIWVLYPGISYLVMEWSHQKYLYLSNFLNYCHIVPWNECVVKHQYL